MSWIGGELEWDELELSELEWKCLGVRVSWSGSELEWG